VKILEIFREIPSLIDGSFVGRFTRHSCDLNNDLDTYIGVMTNVDQLADKELGRKMAAMTQWRANKKNLPQPVCPETGKLLKKISPPELIKKHIRCHCSQLRENWRTGAQCPDGCRGYEKGKCPVCWCTCSLYVTEERHREISILASMAKGGAAEMDPADDARKFLSDSLGVSAMQRHVSSEKYHKVVVDGGMQVQQDGGVPFLSNIVNEGILAQALFIVNDPPSHQATSILRSKVAGVAHPSGAACINFCGETVDLRTYGKSISSNAAGKRSINNRLNGNMLELVDGNDSGNNSPQFVGVKTCTASSVADEALAKKLDRVRKRAGELVFSASSSPGTAAKAGELYKRIVHGNEVITPIVCDFPDKLSQEVVAMTMTLMSPPEKKR
jgi:hypothetical protein